MHFDRLRINGAAMNRSRVSATLTVLATAAIVLFLAGILAPLYVSVRVLEDSVFQRLAFVSVWGFVVFEPLLTWGAILTAGKRTGLRRYSLILFFLWFATIIASLFVHL